MNTRLPNGPDSLFLLMINRTEQRTANVNTRIKQTSLFIGGILLGSLHTGLANASGYPVTVQSCDRQVTFNQAPTAAISNDVNLTEMMLALNLQDNMVGFTGVSGWKTLAPQLRDGIGELPEL